MFLRTNFHFLCINYKKLCRGIKIYIKRETVNKSYDKEWENKTKTLQQKKKSQVMYYPNNMTAVTLSGRCLPRRANIFKSFCAAHSFC